MCGSWTSISPTFTCGNDGCLPSLLLYISLQCLPPLFYCTGTNDTGLCPWPQRHQHAPQAADLSLVQTTFPFHGTDETSSLIKGSYWSCLVIICPNCALNNRASCGMWVVSSCQISNTWVRVCLSWISVSQRCLRLLRCLGIKTAFVILCGCKQKLRELEEVEGRMKI